MSKLIMMRHGQSEWNRLNLFTGWVDIPLSVKGIDEAVQAGKAIAEIPIDVIFVSSLIRAQTTAMIAMGQHRGGKTPRILHPNDDRLSPWENIYSKQTESMCIPVVVSWELNERMYGELQGMNKQETMDRFGKDQVQIWRRSFDIAPPEGESLAMTAARALPYFHARIVPHLQSGKNVLISAHGNSLRAIIMYLKGLSKEEVVNLELPTGQPLFYKYEEGRFVEECITT